MAFSCFRLSNYAPSFTGRKGGQKVCGQGLSNWFRSARVALGAHKRTKLSVPVWKVTQNLRLISVHHRCVRFVAPLRRFVWLKLSSR